MMKPSTRSLLIENGRIIDPSQQIDDIGSILISKGKIIWIGKPGCHPLLPDFESIDASGLIICPGFVDFHCHLREPGYENKETIATGTRAAAKGGFTTVCCMPNTKPPLDNKYIIERIKTIINLDSVIRVLPIACITIAQKGESLTDMRALSSSGIVAFSDDGSPVMNDELMGKALRISKKLGLPVIDHCENLTSTDAWDMNNGITAKKLHLRGMPAGSEESMIERDIAINRKIGGKLHIAHVSTADSVTIIRRAKAEGINITAEVTPHHLTLTETAVSEVNTLAKVNPPLRTDSDIKALVDGLNDNTIDIIATDHAPHSANDKNQNFPGAPFGISNFETSLGSLMALVHENRVSLHTLISKITYHPARIIGDKFRVKGNIAVNSVADITIFDPLRSWTVNISEFISKGKNSPFAGKHFKGKVIATIFQGNIVYYDNSALSNVKG